MFPLPPLYKPNDYRVSWILIENRPQDISAGFTMHSQIYPYLALVRRGFFQTKTDERRDLHRFDLKSDPPAVILAALQPSRRIRRPEPLPSGKGARPRDVDGKGKPQTRGVRANTAVTLMLLANLMRGSTPPTYLLLRGVAIGWKGSRRKR